MKKIMFNDKYGLTQAVLEGRKTMTRRVISIPDKWKGIDVYGFSRVKDESALTLLDGDDFIIEDHATGQIAQVLPNYRIGEEVAVAQSYRNIIAAITPSFGSPHAYDNLRDKPGWNNKSFVRADLMPHRIRITGIKVERLQDITEEDAMREGVFHYDDPPRYHESDRFAPWPPYVKPYKHDLDNLKYRCTARYAFAYLIDKIVGTGTWKKNPWLFAYSFELI